MDEILDKIFVPKKKPKKSKEKVKISHAQPRYSYGSINSEVEELNPNDKAKKEEGEEEGLGQSLTQSKSKKIWILITAFCMVIFGTGQSCVLFLLMSQTLSNGCSYFPPFHFHHAFTILFFVFLGRFLVLPFMLTQCLCKCLMEKKLTFGYAFSTDNNKNPMWYIVICLCNIANLSAILYGTEANTWLQALRIGGPVLVCIIVLDLAIWNKMPQVRDFLSIACIMFGVIVVVVPQIFFTINKSYNRIGSTKPTYNRWWFGLFSLFTPILYAFQNLKEEKIFRCTDKKYSPALMTAYEGLFGMLLTVIILFIMYYVPGYDYGGKWENFPCSIVHLFDIKTNPWVLVLVILLVILSGATCYARLKLTKQLSALHQMVFNSTSVMGSIALQVWVLRPSLEYRSGRYVLGITSITVFLAYLSMIIGSLFFVDVFFKPIQKFYERIPFFYFKGRSGDKVYFLKSFLDWLKLQVMEKNKKLIICVVFVCISLLQSFLYQFVSMSLVKGHNIPPQRFAHPIFVDAVQFMGQFLCLFVYAAIQLGDCVFREGLDLIEEDSKPKTKEEKGVEDQYMRRFPVSCSVFLVSSFFDLLFTFVSLKAIGEINIIMYQLLTVGALTFVWVAIVKFILFKHKIYLIPHRVIGIIIILLISTVTCVLTFDTNRVGYSIAFIIVFIILAQAFLGISLVLEEFFLVQTRPFKPLQIAGFEGFWGIIIAFIVGGISIFWDRTWENTLGAIYSVLFFDPVFILLLFGLMLTSGLTNYLKLVIIKELSGKTKIGAEIMVMVISFRVFPTGFIEVFFLPKKQWGLFLKELAPYFVANIFLIYGMLIYTGYLSNLEFWIPKSVFQFYQNKVDWLRMLGENEGYIEIMEDEKESDKSLHLNFQDYRGKKVVESVREFLVAKGKNEPAPEPVPVVEVNEDEVVSSDDENGDEYFEE